MFFVMSLVLGFALAFAADKEKSDDVTVSGKLTISAKIKPGAAYLMVSSGGGTDMIKPKLESGTDNPDSSREAPPSEGTFHGYLSIGSTSGESHPFEVQLPPGNYQLTAFLKNGSGEGPKCILVPRGSLPVAVSCFPTKGDTVCSGESFNVGKDKDLELKCGEPTAAEPAK